jgi:U3 small nucleolar RNA-associated protein MPP10
LYDFNKKIIGECSQRESSNVLTNNKSLNELYIENFDVEQVWQQIQLQNEPFLQSMVKEVANIVVKSHDLSLNIVKEKLIDSIDSQNNFQINQNLDSIKKSKNKAIRKSDHSVNNNNLNSIQKINKFVNKSGVDDMFFKLSELETFLNNEDLKEEKIRSGVIDNNDEESGDEIDYFADDSSESGDEQHFDDSKDDNFDETNAREAMFSDFFDAPNDANVCEEDNSSSNEEFEENDEEIDTRDIDMNDIEINNNNNNEIGFSVESSDTEDEEFDKLNDKLKQIASKTSDGTDNNNNNKSEFEQIQELLRQKIAKQERENLSSKPWQLSGEIVSDKRPENSLLEEHLHFDHISRPAPPITEETTVKLEDIIKQRIKDSSYDDVERKVKPKEKPFEYRRRITMESEKNKQSLAQVYENEYLKQQQQEKTELENPEHVEIKKLMRNLFVQLDALSNFHYTPRPPQPEVKIINNLPAITAEEVTPLTVSDVSLLAPQEVFNNNKMELQSAGEKSKTDKKRARRAKKVMQSKKQKFNQQKDKASKKSSSKKDSLIGNEKDLQNSNVFKSSKKFFEKLQEKSTQIDSKSKLEKKQNKLIPESKKLKL